MTTLPTERLDCRGLQCPAPILQTARAAKRISTKGIIEIVADDPAFPLDIESWCQSSQSKLLELNQQQNAFTARVLIDRAPSPLLSSPTPTPQPTTQPATQTLDCRGLQCPAPILKLARAARSVSQGSIEILADDPAFPLDVESWCQSAQAVLSSLVKENNTFRATINIGSPSPTSQPLETAHTLTPQTPPAQAPQNHPTFLLSRADLLSPAALSTRLHTLLSASPFLEKIHITSDDPTFIGPLVSWCNEHGHQLLHFDTRTQPASALLQLKPTPLPSPLQTTQKERACTLIILHNDYEALLAAMIVANGAIAQGMKVTLFFTFWGLNLLRGDSLQDEVERAKKGWFSNLFSFLRPRPQRAASTALQPTRSTFIQRMFKWMMPKGPRRQALGQFNFGGMGREMLNGIMREQKVMSLPELLASLVENDARFIACTMSMSVMGISKDDLMDLPNLQLGGVATFIQSAENSSFSMMF